MNDGVLGTDGSHWSWSIDFQKMYDAKARFWFTKASDSFRGTGVLFEDSKFNAFCNQAFAFGKLLNGCFHWLQPDTDPKNAARFYLERYFRFKFQLPPILDFEEVYAYLDRSTGNATHLESHYAWCAQEWLDEIQRNVEKKPLVYSAKWFTDHFEKRLLSWLSEYPLIVAQYPGIQRPTENDHPLMPYPWTEWLIWQYSADGNNRGYEFGYASEDVDIDYYPNSYEDLLNYVNAEEPEMPDMQPTGNYKIVLTGNLSVRTKPTTVGSVVLGYGLAGDVFIATEKTADNWYKVVLNGVGGWISGRTKYTVITEILAPVEPGPEPEPEPELTVEERLDRLEAAVFG